ncbi:MAG: glucan biosynthesis protein [Gammaproteobacteria bacterium]
MHLTRVLTVAAVLTLAGCASIVSVRKAQQAADTANQRADRDDSRILALETRLRALHEHTDTELAAVNARSANNSAALARVQTSAASAQSNARTALAQIGRTQQALNLAIAGRVPAPVTRNPEVEADHVFQQLVASARAAAARAYTPPVQTAPAPLATLNSSTYSAIRWHGQVPAWPDDSRFALAFQPAGYIYKQGVSVHLVEGTRAEAMQFSPDEFTLPADLGGKLPHSLPIAGVNLFYRFGDSTSASQFLSFLGASYFRALGQGQWWGLSARGLAVDTAVPDTAEGFPAFRAFWIVVPPPHSTTLTVLAELDGPSVTGAYRFLITPGVSTTIAVRATLFLRHAVKRLGLAPLTSMFLQGPSSTKKFDLLHPAIHDSDGLQIDSGDGHWLWHPLQNPERLSLIHFALVQPVGYGLMQRERSFSEYQYVGRHYQDRPSAWVSFEGNWGPGTLDLIEIPSHSADDDNIVTFWEPQTPPAPGQALNLRYTIAWQATQPTLPPLGWTVESRVAYPARDTRIFSVYFTGAELGTLPPWVALQPEIDAGTDHKVSDVTLVKLPDSNRWRLRFTIKGAPSGRIDAHLGYHGRILTEDWNWGG